LLPAEPEAAAGDGTSRARVAVEVAVLFAALLATLLAASSGFGLAWDEVTYFDYADSIRGWWRSGAPLNEAALSRAWAYDTYSNPHPPFMKIVAALGRPLASRWLAFPTDYRFGHLVWVSGCLSAAWLLLRGRFGALAATTAVAFVVLQPRMFGHLLIAATDSPVALAWLLLALLAWRLGKATPGRSRTVLWIGFFVAAGCAAATKFTGLLALAPVAAWFAWRRRWTDAALAVTAGVWGVAFMVLASPQLWHHPLRGALQYLSYPLSRQATPFTTAYFGHLYRNDLPWHYFAVMSVVTISPLLLSLLPAAGLVRGELRDALGPAAASLAFWLVLVHLPKTPRHDEVRQFLSVFPLLALLAWGGLLVLLARVGERLPPRRRALFAAAGCVASIAALGATVARAHPFELSYYNPVIGGVRGAERRGMELSLYLEAIDHATLAALDRQARPGETLFMSPYWPKLLQAYVDHDLLHVPLLVLPQEPGERPDWLLLVRRRYLFDDALFVALPAVHEVRYDGVSLVKLVRTADVPGGGRAAR
jgi:4-amino-4-deoxy-L-arabinose transferase-like glycosyltransferase